MKKKETFEQKIDRENASLTSLAIWCKQYDVKLRYNPGSLTSLQRQKALEAFEVLKSAFGLKVII